MTTLRSNDNFWFGSLSLKIISSLSRTKQSSWTSRARLWIELGVERTLLINWLSRVRILEPTTAAAEVIDNSSTIATNFFQGSRINLEPEVNEVDEGEGRLEPTIII